MKLFKTPKMSKLPQKRDANGFKIKQVEWDASQISAHDQLGGGAHLVKGKTILEEEAEGANYYIDGPLRKITPYYFTFMTFCKQRWLDRKLVDIFTSEFRMKPPQYYVNAIEDGQVTLNKEVANMDSIVRNGDLISHRIHRHEPAVSSRPIKIVHEDDEIIVIDKPSGIPAHPTGRFRYNTITMIMKHERGQPVHTCNRLDRLTSGLMFLGKTSKGTDKLVRQIREREVSKQYIARVIGRFPTQEIVVEEPLKSIDPRLGLNCVDKGGKEAKTSFKRISYDGETSIVLCKPYTGRTHQIRVHLQWIGHPIANDPLYSSPSIWGEELGRGGNFDLERVMSLLHEVGKTRVATSWFHPHSSGELLLEETCDTCDSELYSDPGPNDLDLWLHAFRYAAHDLKWSYETELPEWALEPHRQYMEMAISEANKCEETTTAFSVGAVLVKDDKVLSTGFSRELEGNTHAEQNALEKYFSETGDRKIPSGSVIYTTMEPCSERLSGNLPCADRLIEAGSINACFVGVVEPDTFIKDNVGRKKLESTGITYIHIPGYEKRCLDIAFRGHSLFGGC